MFKLISKNKNRRTGLLKTKNGVVNTPFFMPDATRGFVRSLSKNDLEKIGMGPMVVNTYHLYLQPGTETIKKAGGVHDFMNWHAPLLSDSGGYQVFSLIHKNPQMGKITDEKVVFKSPIDGSKHELSPEKAIQIQFDLGVDMMVCLDDPPPNNYSKKKIEKAVERTIAWAKRCKIEYEKQIKKRKIGEKNRPLLFGVIQGGEYLDLRKYCTENLIKIGFDGYGFGARHIDGDGNFLEEVLRETVSFIPEDSLRFALGVGTPDDIIRCAAMGWDMFDCVIPTREGRHGRLFIWKNKNVIPTVVEESENILQNPDPSTSSRVRDFTQDDTKGFYETININNKKYANDFTPVDPDCDCELCQNYTKAYLRHMFAMKEPLAMRLASIHNLKFYLNLMKKIKQY